MPPEEKDEVQESIDERKQTFGESETKDTDTDAKETESEEAAEESSTSEEETESTESEGEGESEGKLEEATEETEDTDDLEEEPKTKKTGAQKRIDRLTADKYELQAQIDALKTKVDKAEPGEKTYSDAELDKAEQKAATDNDMALMMEVNKERMKNQERKLIKMYESDRESQTKATTEHQKEWQSVIERYANEDPAFDIRSQNSDLYKIAKAYFEDPQFGSDYKGPGGMLRAVADAYLELVRIQSKKKKSPKEKVLERKLAKSKMKSQLGAGSSQKVTKTEAPKSSGDAVKDFISERQADREERSIGALKEQK